MTYATLDDVKNEVRSQSFTTANERYLMQALRAVTRRVLNIAGPRMDFEPRLEQRKFSANTRTVNSQLNLLTLGDYLLEITALSNDGTALTLNTDYFVYPAPTDWPIQALRMAWDSSHIWYPCDSVYDSILITGWWGFKTRYSSEGWIDTTEDVPVGGLTDSAASFTAADVDGVDDLYRTPRLSAGNLIKIDSEVMEVLATNITTNAVTVRRGQRGTTAAAHTAGTAIYAWNVEEGIRYAVARAAAYSYSRIGAFNTTQTAADLTTVTYPADFPAQVRAAIQEYANG